MLRGTCQQENKCLGHEGINQGSDVGLHEVLHVEHKGMGLVDGVIL